MAFQTPVALFLFNRPRETARVWEVIARLQPRRLLLVADGPRNSAEAELCQATRRVVARVDWPCEVSRDFAEVNLGCKQRMSRGIDWVFAQVEQAILLEDDCVADDSFFPFCAELLQRYRDDERVMLISGDNFQFGQRRSDDSYYFSRLPHIWGWATWRRAWRHYDVTMQHWPALKEAGWLNEFLSDARLARHFTKVFDDIYSGKVDTWDLQWTLAIWARAGVCIIPQVNLVSNIGFGPAATHTRSTRSPNANLPMLPMEFPLKHPLAVEIQQEADAFSLGQLVGTGNV